MHAKRKVPFSTLQSARALGGCTLRFRPATTTRGPLLETAEELAEAIGRALGEELANAWRLRITVTGEAIAGEAAEIVEPAAATGAIDALSVVLSTTGSGSWQLTSPGTVLRDERRDAHRRTRRGKQHRRVRGGEALVQPRLFADRK